MFYPSGPDWRWLSWRQVASIADGSVRPPAEQFGGCGVDIPTLLSAAIAFGDAAGGLSLALGAAPSRDIVVVHGRAERDLTALLVAWSVRTGAAMMVEPDSPRWPQSLVWARPTVVLGDAQDLDRLAEALRRVEPKPQRLRRKLGPLGRVRAVARIGPPGTSGSDPWWAGVGLPVLSLSTT